MQRKNQIFTTEAQRRLRQIRKTIFILPGKFSKFLLCVLCASVVRETRNVYFTSAF